MKTQNKDSQFPRFFIAPEGEGWTLTLCLMFTGPNDLTFITRSKERKTGKKITAPHSLKDCIKKYREITKEEAALLI